MTPDQVAALRAALGLAAHADGSAIVTAAQDLTRRVSDLGVQLKLEGKPIVEIASAAITRLAVIDPSKYVEIAAHNAVKAELDGLKEQNRKAEIAAVVDQAIKDGKVTPGQREQSIALASVNLDGFKAFVEKATAVVAPGSSAAQLAARQETGQQAQVVTGVQYDPDRLALHNKALAHQAKHGGTYEAAVRAVAI